MQDIESVPMPSEEHTAGIRDTTRQADLWQRLALSVILLISIILNFFNLGNNPTTSVNSATNSYYAAAVKSMSLNWHNFFFAAFDPQGFLAIDKPPLGFWFQVISVRLFGFSSWSILLPEALAGVGAVIVLYVLVRRVFGINTGLLAALVLALTPISVVTSRNNTIDSLLIFTLLLATWALCIATEKGSLRWLLISMALVGLGFNIKMLEAYLVLPAFILVYLLTAPQTLRIRIFHLILAGVVLIIISFSWISIVDLVPTTQRPYISSTQHDSELELALGYNGVSRVLGVGSVTTTTANGTTTPGNATSLLVIFGIAVTGLPGPLRLFNALLGGQIAWLIPLAMLGFIATLWRGKWPRQAWTSKQQSILLWGTWLIVLLIFFSLALFDHPYYMVTFAPAICAMVGIGGAALYRAYRDQTDWKSWLLPIALFITALVQGEILAPYPTLSHILAPICIGLSLISATMLVIARLSPRWPKIIHIKNLFIASIIILLLAPTTWAILPSIQGTDTINPTAGPQRSGSVLGALAHEFIPEASHAQPQLEKYLLEHQGNARYLVATINASTAAPFILDTGQSALALGGYNSFDPILSPQQVATLVQQDQLRFFLLPTFAQFQLQGVSPQILKTIKGILQPSSLKGESIIQPAITQWVTTHCSLISREAVEPGTSGTNDTVSLGYNPELPTQLYGCASIQS